MKFYVTEEEKRLIDEKMSQLPTRRYGAYLRKMAIDGYVVKLDLPELRELVSLLRYSSNNLNQLTRRAQIPCAANPAIIPVSTSPLPPVAIALLPVVLI